MNQFLSSRTLKTVLGAVCAIIFAVIIFFNFDNFMVWATLNNPFQGQWAAVQLLDGEILYGHFAGVSGTTIGLKDVYVLDKFTPAAATSPVAESTASSTDFSLGGTSQSEQPQPKYIPVTDTELLYVNRTAVSYFKFVPPGDPALPYLH
ncbi:MAG: hypothetical protein WCF77_02720 [Minisyncoccia bacterium]